MASNLKACYIVGAGTAVIRKIENEATAAENPAKVIKKHIPEKQGGRFHKKDNQKCAFRKNGDANTRVA
ncbi:hypothetical protein D3Z51_17540 [Clostridiaceae bacterium]|nr:hypothetical protein [Clostridiaceae bacterium]RKI09968.1 hypothetical protein D7V81_16725 [bacterium 1XD21-70]